MQAIRSEAPQASQAKPAAPASPAAPGGRRGRGPGAMGPGGPGPRPTASALFDRFDKDKKGSLTKADVPERVWQRISQADANQDGSVSKDELETFIKTHRPGGSDRKPESKPADKPQNENPQPPKAEDSKATTLVDEPDQPVDALTAVGVL